jgi:hypothetical protein
VAAKPYSWGAGHEGGIEPMISLPVWKATECMGLPLLHISGVTVIVCLAGGIFVSCRANSETHICSGGGLLSLCATNCHANIVGTYIIHTASMPTAPDTADSPKLHDQHKMPESRSGDIWRIQSYLVSTYLG